MESGGRVSPDEECPLGYPVRTCTNGAGTSVESSLCCAAGTVNCRLGGTCQGLQADKISSGGSSGTSSSGGSSGTSGTSTSSGGTSSSGGTGGTSGGTSGTSGSGGTSDYCGDDDDDMACAVAIAPGARDAGGAAATMPRRFRFAGAAMVLGMAAFALGRRMRRDSARRPR